MHMYVSLCYRIVNILLGDKQIYYASDVRVLSYNNGKKNKRN